MDNTPLISVIIPVYNVEKFLPQCIESVLNQTYTNLEIILINDGSIDNSLEICTKYKDLDSRVQVINKMNQGAGYARNDGIKAAKGVYIYFMDSDDFIEKDTFLRLSQYFLFDPDIIQFGFRRINESGKYLNEVIPPELSIEDLQNNKENLAKILKSGVGLAVWDKIIKRELIVNNNLLFENINRVEDAAYNISLYSKSKKIISVPYSFVNYRILLGRQSKFSRQIVKDQINIFERMLKLFDQGGKNSEEYLCQIFFLWFFMVIPINIAGNKLLTYEEKKTYFSYMFNDSILIDFVKTRMIGKGLNKRFLRWAFLNKMTFIFLIYGSLIKWIRNKRYK
ncbi:MAG TPA: glycosyltransferase [Chitinophagaceae bacterium]|nr:glycosyltransferase [Chitinophagaceae bacterium]